MDPPTLVNEGSFASTNVTAYNLAEIWPFGINGGESNDGGLDIRRSQYAQDLSRCTGASGNLNPNLSIENPLSLSRRAGCRGSGSKKRRDSQGESAKVASTSYGNEMNDDDIKGTRTSGSRDESRDAKAEACSSKLLERAAPPADPPKQDYIHVRARRGQATDSHSLAERARREKISERMRILQDLVPGCNKVIGKALVLDEIINYIQSLQRQVEFLSMKLETVNSRLSPGIEDFTSKDASTRLF